MQETKCLRNHLSKANTYDHLNTTFIHIFSSFTRTRERRFRPAPMENHRAFFKRLALEAPVLC